MNNIEKEGWERLKTALNVANQRGAFNLNESSAIVNDIVMVEKFLNSIPGKEAEEKTK
jgi:hypothetical protein